MAWIQGTLERTVVVNAPYDRVIAFFKDPDQFRAAFNEMEKVEEVEELVWHWILREKREKGIVFQGNYIVEYTEHDDGLEWTTREGNIRSEGRTECRDAGGGRTEVTYKEQMQTDLPIPRLAAKVFQPIVGREVRNGIGAFLDKAVSLLEAGDS